jgi:glycosyltransferase involved in cell wall biosynthesis
MSSPTRYSSSADVTSALRLLFVMGSLGSGGAERQLVTLARALVTRGHSVEFFTYHADNFYKPWLDEARIPLHCHVKQRKVSWQMVRHLRNLLRQGGFHIVHSIMPGPNVWALLAGMGLRNRPKIIVSECFVPNEKILGRAGMLSQSLIDQMYRLADHLTVNSYYQLDDYTRRYRWIRSRASCIWNGVDLDRFPFCPPPGLRAPLRLIGVGRIAWYKNWECALEALAILRDQHQFRPVVTHVGRLTDLTPEDERYRLLLNERAAALGLGEQWSWVGEISDVPGRLAQCHALIHPSLAEGLPNVVCEALACGRPVLASNILDHPRLIQDGKSGFLFDPHSPRSLAAAILKLHELSEAEMAKMGRAARDFAEVNLSNARLANDYERLFRELCGDGAVPGTSQPRGENGAPSRG